MMDLFRKNKPVFLTFVALVLFLVAAIACQGCSLQKVIKVQVPAGVVSAVNVQPEVSLSEATGVVEDWNAYVASNSKKLQASVQAAEGQYQTIASLVNLSLDASSSLFPGGVIVSSGLSLLAGLFLKRPGEDKRVASEKEASYNAGIALAKAMLLDSESKETRPKEPA